MATEKGFLKGLIFRLVKKHIAGSTADSAIRMALKLNAGKVHTSITFLNESPRDSAQVRYNVNAYMQLMRQISRLHAKSDVSLRPSQFGYHLGNGIFAKGLEEIAEKADEAQIDVWVESESARSAHDILDAFETCGSKRLGIEIPKSEIYDKSVCDRCRRSGVKIKISDYADAASNESGKSGGAKKSKKRDRAREPLLEDVLKLFKGRSAVLSSSDERSVYRAIKSGNASKKSIVFETLYGISPKRVRKLIKDNINVSIYIPYGKDWVPFAIKRLTEGHIRDIAVAILDGEAKRAVDRDGEGD